jgi:hypothetical protein
MWEKRYPFLYQKEFMYSIRFQEKELFKIKEKEDNLICGKK